MMPGTIRPRVLATVGICCLLLTASIGAAAEPSRVAFDFETGDPQGWEVVEGKFARVVCDWEFFHNRPKDRYNKQGKYYLNTLELSGGKRTDAMTGVLESPVFVLRGGSVSFLVGGGKHAQTYVALATEDGNEVFQARGKNTETMQRITWDVGKLLGKRVFLRIVDRHTGSWGHVTFDDFQAPGRIDPEATRRRVATREVQRLEKQRQDLVKVVQTRATSLRRAIEDLAATFKDRYPKGQEYLARLDSLARPVEKADVQQMGQIRGRLDALAREALIANPLLSGRPILFVVRHQYKPDHHNTATMFQTGEINTASFSGGGSVKTIDLTVGEGKTLLDLPEGVARDLEVGFDGRKILFSMRRNRQDDYHLYEMQADGSGLRQLTFGSGVSDVDPIYLPDGNILFTSTREPKYCMCNRHIMGNLFVMEADGAGIQQIGHSTLHEGHPSLLADGRVIYDRWEYVDRNFGDAQGVWSTNPDGTNHAVYWGNNTNSPGAVLDARIIPGAQQIIATFSSCHDRPWGALAIVDRRLGTDGKPPVVRTWPPGAINLVGVGDYDTFIRVNPKYEDPFPLSQKHFLCSRMTGDGQQMGIWLIDVFGNEILVHAEAPGCYDPMPLGARPTPPVISPRIDLAKGDGYFYVADVYDGAWMERIDRGEVKYLRVVESPEKRFFTQPAWNTTGNQSPAMAWDDFNNKRILGTVPVESDGSAHFAVPADTFVYFQLLDERGMMVQSMRSGTIVRPGETAGCVGCHEGRRSTVPPSPRPLAMRRGPSKLEPWYGPARTFGFLAEVQPVFDKHCVECHDYGAEGGKKLNLAGDLVLSFNTAYVELRTKGYVKVVGAGPFQVQPPKSWGSHASRLVKVLLDGHEDPRFDKDVKLDKEDFDRVVTWIDVNAPYYPEYASAYRDNKYGRSPLDAGQLQRLVKLTGVDLNQQELSAAVSFTRPQLSPCLAKLSNPGDSDYREALAIIRSGGQLLARRPRADMTGFRLISPIEIDQQAKYQARLQEEKSMRAAIIERKR